MNRWIFFLMSILLLVSACGKNKSGTEKKTKEKSLYPLKSKSNNKLDFDLDKNGKIDLVAIYDEHGHLKQINRDINENGKVEKLIYYQYHPRFQESRKYKEQFDDNEDGQLDGERVYDGERLLQAWYDSDYNGKPDVWQSMDRFDRLETKIDSDGDQIPDKGGDHIAKGNELNNQKRYDEAYNEYKSALNYNSRSYMAYWGMATSLENLHNYELAIKHYERYIFLNGGNKVLAQKKINYLKKKLAKDFRR